MFYFVKRNQESGYFYKIPQFSDFDKYFKEFQNNACLTEDICETIRACDSLEQWFSVLAAN